MAPITAINAKPSVFLFLMVVLGTVLEITRISTMYAAALIIVALVALLFMPKVPLIEFFNDYLVMYNKADKGTCELIYYEDIVSWHYSRGASNDYLHIELSNGKQEQIEGFSKVFYETQMNRFVKDKRKKNVKQ